MLTPLRAVWGLMAGNRTRYAAAIVAMACSSAFLYLSPLIGQLVIDGVLLPPSAAGTPWSARAVEWLGGRTYLRNHLWQPGLWMVGLTALAGVFTYFRARWATLSTEAIARNLRDRLYDHLQRLPAAYFDRADTGDLLQRCTSDVETLRSFLGGQIVEIGRALFMFVIPIPIMMMIDWRMTAVSVVLVPFIVLYSAVFFLRVKATFERADQAEARMHTAITENLAGIRVVRAFARQAYENERFGARNQEFRDLDCGHYRLIAWFWSASDLLCMLQKGLVVTAGIYWMGRGQLTVGAFFYFLTVVWMFIFPMRMLGRIVSELGKAIVAIGRLREILDLPLEREPSEPRVPEVFTGAVTFESVDFAYREGTPVLHDIDLQIGARETVAFIGASGAGKSTLVALLLGLYEPTRGTIRIDGVDIREIPRKTLRGRIGVVMQQPFLFSKTIAENLRLARASADQSELEAAASVASVHDSIQDFEHRYATTVGERGITLSGGQRQRIALARALLQEPTVLVLDDALSAVDVGTETTILDGLAQRRGRQTTLLIAHRLSTVRLADRIVVLEDGRIAQVGRHEELIAVPGLYARLWQLQSATDVPASDEPAAFAAGGNGGNGTTGGSGLATPAIDGAPLAPPPLHGPPLVATGLDPSSLEPNPREPRPFDPSQTREGAA